LIPHNGGWQQAFAEAHAFAVPLRGRAATGKGKEPAQAALLEITSPKLVLSGLKFAEDGDGIIVRLYNIDDRPVRARLRLNEPHDAAEFVNLNEERIAKAAEKDGWVSLALRRNEIVSLRFRAKMPGYR
jgi:alpha-mannosidase